MKNPVHTLWRRTVEVVKEYHPDCLAGYAYADALDVGWYASRHFGEQNCGPTLVRALPEFPGAVFPYLGEHGELSHIRIVGFKDEGGLSARKRVLLAGSRSRRQGGVFGGDRLKRKHPSMVLTDDEEFVMKHGNVIAISEMRPWMIKAIRRATPIVNVKGTDPAWVEQMIALARFGLNVEIDGLPVVEYVTQVVVRMHNDNLGVSVVAGRFTALITPMVSLQRMAVIQRIRAETGLDFSPYLPDDFSIYRREGEFYKAIETKLAERITGASVEGHILSIELREGEPLRLALDRAVVGAAIAQIFEVPYDLVDWAYHHLLDLPRFYVQRGRDGELETRAAVSGRIADAVLAILLRKARITA